MKTDTYEGMVLDDANDMAQYADDKRLIVMFFRNPVLNKTKTKLQGRPIYDEYDYIRILTPGSKDTFETEIVDSDEGPSQYKLRFATQWDRYKSNQEQLGSGTPIDSVPWLTVGQIMEFKGVNVRTVEQLVGMADAVAQKFMGIHQIQQRARAFLEAADAAAPGLALAAQLEERDEKITELQGQMKQLIAALAKKETEEQGKLIPKG